LETNALKGTAHGADYNWYCMALNPCVGDAVGKELFFSLDQRIDDIIGDTFAE